MDELIWHVAASDDLDTIAEFIARQSPDYTPLFLRRVVAAAEGLRVFPLSGREVPEIGEETYREVIFQNYRIVYRPLKGRVIVIGVIHAAMDMTREARKREWDVT